MSSVLPTPFEVREAAGRIAGAVVRTSLTRSAWLSAAVGGDVHIKRECEQTTGSFKLRGATNVIATLTPEERARGVVTASAGNHGLGLATAAKAAGVRAQVFVPASAPMIKREKILATGASVHASAPTYDTAESIARLHAFDTGATFVSPCTGRALLAGQGTVALEIIEQLPAVASVVVCVGGGGLAGGIGGLLRAERPEVRIIGAQAERTNAMALAIASGEETDIPDLPTLADGLAGLVDDEMLAQGQQSLHDIATVGEPAIEKAIRALYREEGLTVEGAGAVGVAALLTGAIRPTQFPVVVIVSGANIDPDVHQRIVAS